MKPTLNLWLIIIITVIKHVNKSIKALYSTSYFGIRGNVVVNHHIYLWNIQSPTKYVGTKENFAVPRLELFQGFESLWL
jgi:hypothetical protein